MTIFNFSTFVDSENLCTENFTSVDIVTCFESNIKNIVYINELTSCSYVRLNTTQYQVVVDHKVVPPNVAITIDFKVTKIKITENRDLIMVDVDKNENLDVCVALLDRKLKQEQDTGRRADHCKDTLCMVENILTLLCFLISMVCLLLTLLTYCMFPVLRTKAGVNNMFLSLSLLLAQVSLMISAYTSALSIPCKLIGIMTHFLWLWNFSWNFICSFNMVRVFTASRGINNQRNMTHGTWKWLSCSFILPVLVVSAVIIFNHFTSQGREFGYGNEQCYLDSPLLIGLTVATPLFVITLINVSFFLVAVYKIYSVRRLQSDFLPSTAQDFSMTIYIKLSTVTGMFWIVAVLAEFSDNKIFGFIALVLNGFQGLSIFLAFVCNKRVVTLYSSLWRRLQA
ncbi:adhesion G-protein coupled receptor D1 [Biomphalaria pfeifferi]|uniref:Adhesion G-protein coupled receptor D1 n=1 Tax=Biomphalaria pfeifferi TaxID=112525 RepID=A0AAD8B5Z7_BIOPF|nr:adhesion G-protein coupled receptor D1 [Biomphalaria pfeifferi]